MYKTTLRGRTVYQLDSGNDCPHYSIMLLRLYVITSVRHIMLLRHHGIPSFTSLRHDIIPSLFHCVITLIRHYVMSSRHYVRFFITTLLC